MTATSWKMLAPIALVLALAYIGMIVLLAIFQRSLIYHPDTSAAGTPEQAGLKNGRVIEVTTQDGLKLKGWFLEREQSDAPVILFYHGNAGHHGWRTRKLKTFYQAGFSVLMAGYRGYGGNPGTPHEQGLYQDGRAYYDWLIGQNGTVPANIIIYGESLGTGVATKIAADHKGGGLVLETPFDSLTATAKVHYPYIPFIDILLHDHFPSDQRIADIHMPVLIMIAGQDNVVPPERGRRLYEIAHQPKQLKYLADATHNEIDEDTLTACLADFQRQHLEK